MKNKIKYFIENRNNIEGVINSWIEANSINVVDFNFETFNKTSNDFVAVMILYYESESSSVS